MKDLIAPSALAETNCPWMAALFPVNIIVEFVPLGDQTSVAIAVDRAPDPPLFMTVPTYVAQRNDLTADKRISASLFAKGIYHMPLSEEGQT